ncbi:hypothetical protein SCCGRSA3_02010 [Marine Group I thaumarchaeote SCGC RSA3]|uniref:ArnR1-like winged helix-turn-helix domain-containing protein n=2 Tax=Marine Group I TaxID=905826 RepID=A0A081RNV6_9ARCH|nr:hypothetical protein AAA799N04_00549 [Marine Group I thaumarchaeote SCGC AAA799-N04]KFM16975.1 hypothetical protein SCCGRSA3_02010 [Marine Group I thaumarchaeote SCGC RSA3]
MIRENATYSREELDNVSWHVVERILLAFYEHGSLKKTQITAKSGLKYNSCMRYLNWLNTKMGFVEFELSSDHKQISSIRLSSEGFAFCKKRILENENLNKIKSRNRFLFA